LNGSENWTFEVNIRDFFFSFNGANLIKKHGQVLDGGRKGQLFR
jgi:hypothetical protein